jgi:hypothetical protein
MLIVDNVLLSPFRSLFWIFREIHNAVQDELANESEAITAELRELYMMIEAGRITEAEFDARERTFLNRLDEIDEIEDRRIGIEEDEDKEDQKLKERV